MEDKKQKVIPLKIFLAETSGKLCCVRFVAAHLQSKQNSFAQDSLLSQVEATHQKMLMGLRESVQKMAMLVMCTDDSFR